MTNHHLVAKRIGQCHNALMEASSSPSSDHQTVEALLAYAQAAVSLLSTEESPNSIPTFHHGWVVERPGLLTQRIERHPYYEFPSRADIAGYELARESIRRDPILAPLLGKSVGSSNLRTSVGISENFILGLVESALRRPDGTPSLDENLIRDCVQRLLEFCQQEVLTAHLLIPIPGLQLSGPVVIDEGVSFTDFTDEEVRVLAENDVLQKQLGGTVHLYTSEYRGVRIVLNEKSAVWDTDGFAPTGDWTPALNRYGIARPERMAFLIEEVLLAMRLADDAEVVATGAALVSVDWGGHTSSTQFFRRTSRLIHQVHYELSDSRQQAISSAWQALKANARQSHPLPAIATRRFSQSTDRMAVGDQIVDLMVCLESLLIPRGNTSELGYRLALHGSILCEQAGLNRRASFQFLKAAYGARSQIVHGTDSETMKFSGRGRVHFSDIQRELADIVRVILGAALTSSAVQPDEKFGSQQYWDKLILGP